MVVLLPRGDVQYYQEMVVQPDIVNEVKVKHLPQMHTS